MGVVVGKIEGSFGCLSDWVDFRRRAGGRLRFLAPDETAGADLHPRSGGWLGNSLRLDSPPRPDRGARRGPPLRAGERARLGDFGRIRPSVEAGRRCRSGHFRVDVRTRYGCRILGEGNSTRLGPSLEGEQVPGDQDEIGQEERQDDRRDRPACRDDQDDPDSGSGREDRTYEVARLGGRHGWWDLGRGSTDGRGDDPFPHSSEDRGGDSGLSFKGKGVEIE
jgi:hypothetical protein